MKQFSVPFDFLPEDGLVNLIPDGLAVLSLSRSHFYELEPKGKVPPIEADPHGTRRSKLSVGEIRRYLADPANYLAPARDGLPLRAPLLVNVLAGRGRHAGQAA